MSELTVGELRRQLDGLDDDVKLSFSGGLTFYRLKRWGDDEFIVEFNEPQADLSDSFKRKNPNVKVAFIDISNVEWDESGVIGGPIDVGVR
ncbi:hypothetical protein [Cupriavidus numazuensis]|uniref:Uncharacterized protein n=1 Tax=Cupriavidus numazuensis TaxID=221992 RepID=A0ABM8TAB2_9BURK|nr:hypothetical protein [Cupriavidus numazuensis]CAG2130764.1 hypothetical protein LMG26411_00409 [Cupriavidus numazuensis]